MKTRIALPLMLSLFFACKTDTTEKQTKNIEPLQSVAADSAASVFQTQGESYFIKNTTYQRVDFFRNEKPFHAFVKLTAREKQTGDSIENSIDVQLMNSNFADAKQYSVSYPAQTAVSDFGTVQLMHKAKGDGEDTYWLVNPANGELLMQYTFSRLTVLIPNSRQKRFFGFVARSSEAENFEDKSLIGYLYYASNMERISRIAVRAKSEEAAAKMQAYTPLLEFYTLNNDQILEGQNQMILMHTPDKFKTSDISRFGVSLKFYIDENATESVIEVPVVNDKIDESKVKADKNVFQLNAE